LSSDRFQVSLCLPAQAAAETEATIVKWHVAEKQNVVKGDILAEAESAKSTFQFESPCDATIVRLLAAEGTTVAFDAPVVKLETADPTMRSTDATVKSTETSRERPRAAVPMAGPDSSSDDARTVYLLGVGGYLPKRVITNKDLLAQFPEITEEYIFGVTGIKERRWADPDEKPTDMAHHAALEAIAKSHLKAKDIDGIVFATATPDFAMPASSCILAKHLGIAGIPAVDINAACSGWLYAIAVAKGFILSGISRNVLVVGSELQSRILDKHDRNTYFLFGDGAGAAVVSDNPEGHAIRQQILAADPAGLHMARREVRGYEVPANTPHADPWIRLDGKALFRFATESFATTVRQVIDRSGWTPESIRWVVPHQANSRIIKAAAQKSGIPFERFYLNIDRLGNTSSASIPLALTECEKYLKKTDKLVLCSVGAGVTYAAVSLEW
jgi:3-oxoacyl-[acyl-carrier-protein] synthase-3